MNEIDYGELEIYINYDRLSVRDLGSLLTKINRLYGAIAAVHADPDMEYTTFPHLKYYNELEIVDFEKGSLRIKTKAREIVITVLIGVMSSVMGSYVYEVLTDNKPVMQDKIINKATELYKEITQKGDYKNFIFIYKDSSGEKYEVQIKVEK